MLTKKEMATHKRRTAMAYAWQIKRMDMRNDFGECLRIGWKLARGEHDDTFIDIRGYVFQRAELHDNEPCEYIYASITERENYEGYYFFSDIYRFNCRTWGMPDELRIDDNKREYIIDDLREQVAADRPDLCPFNMVRFKTNLWRTSKLNWLVLGRELADKIRKAQREAK